MAAEGRPRLRRGAPACSRSRFSGWISGWRAGALYPLAVAADRRGRFSFYGSAMAERRRGCGWPPAPPRRHFGSRCCARSGIAPRQPFPLPSRARARRQLPIPDRGFIFWFQRRDAGAAAVGGAGRRWCRRRSSIAAELGGGCRRPPAPPRRRRGVAPACFLSEISGWGIDALYPLAGSSRAARRAGVLIFCLIDLARSSSLSIGGAVEVARRIRCPPWPAPVLSFFMIGAAWSELAGRASARPACSGVVRGRRRVFSLRFQAGESMLFIHWQVSMVSATSKPAPWQRRRGCRRAPST